ncbi:MAG TPA: hypothetical protein PKJ99_12575 [Thermoanaerobaculales bacterium]|nr:hypothetical protein [Thermoanaerobaculales bacterium]HQL31202.1 hypothetical protein [Thermoanaerobaculales bacterium]
MSETPTYTTVREAIDLIKQWWPEAGTWPELLAVESRLPSDPALLGAELSDSERGCVAELLGRVADQPIPRPLGTCGELLRWVEAWPPARPSRGLVLRGR